MVAILAPLWQELRAQPRLSAIALALFFTYAFFVGPSAWNQNSRLALTRALVEGHTTTIDAYQHTTGDKSWRSFAGESAGEFEGEPGLATGHFYSDKAPGTSLLATVPYGLFYVFKRVSGGELPDASVVPLDPIDRSAGRSPRPDELKPGDVLRYNPAHRVALYLCKLGTSTALAMLGLAAFYLVALRIAGGGAPARRIASRATLIYGLATPALAYGASFYGHQPCADLLLLAFALVVLTPSRRGEAHRGHERPLGIMVGFALGLAVATEYPAAFPAALLFVWAISRRGLHFGLWCASGASLWVAVLAAYHYAAFGDPLRTGYDFVYLPEFASGMARRYGFASPRPAVALELLFGSYRGLFQASPVLLLAAWGLGRALTTRVARSEYATPRVERRDYAVAGAIFTYYLLLNAGYYMWDGGAAFGPRHMVPALPFLALGLVGALSEAPFATAALAIVSGFQAVIVTAAGPEAPTHGHPVWSYAVPELLSQVPPAPGASTTLGELLGLPGPLALIPLLALWVWMLPRVTRET